MHAQDPDAQNLEWPDRSSMSMVLAFFSNGWIFLEHGYTIGEWGDPDFQIVDGGPLSEDDLTIWKRFADMFDFAYSRFLELKEKEDQNRELMIQNAIKRVRSRALGMQASSELDEVSAALFEAVGDLGIEKRATLIAIADEEADEWQNSIQVEGVEDLASCVRKISEILAGGKALGAPLIEAWQQGKSHIVEEYRGDEWVTHTNYWSDAIKDANPNFVGLDEIDRCFVLYANNRFGALGLARSEPPISDDEIEVMQRLSQVFEFAYSRFRELKEKEDQNRELTIQNALERVRAQAQGMQESSEIADVTTAPFEEFQNLGFELRSSIIGLLEPETRKAHCWVGRTYNEDKAVGDPRPGFEIDPKKTPPGIFREAMDALWEAWEQGEAHSVIEIEGEAENRAFNKDMIIATGGSEEYAERRVANLSIPLRVFNRVSHSRGWISYSLDRQLTEEELVVAKRFTDVFDYAYGRFRELEEKEEQARAADQRAAVDRVRAEATAMEKTEDIANVVKALWEGLQGQNVDYDFLSMEVIDEDANLLQAYAAIPDGSPILSLLAMDAQQGPRREQVADKLLEGVNLLRSEISLSDAIEAGFSKADLSRTVLTDSGGDDRSAFREKVWGLSPSADTRPMVKAVRAGFNHGAINLYMGIDVEIVDETVALVEALGEAVSLGFARYWDFRELEEQNRALEEANEEVREATRLKSQFLATMSHELRTPMNAIIGFTRLVLRRAASLEDRQRENLEKVQLSADHLLTLINDILDLSKVEAGRVDLKPKTFKVPPLLQQCCATVGPTLVETNRTRLKIELRIDQSALSFHRLCIVT